MALQLLTELNKIEVRDSDLEGVDGGDPETVYTVKQITPAVTRELAKRHTTTPINRRTGTREERVDHNALIDDVLDVALVAWSGILINGEPAPCDRTHKLLLDFSRKTALVAVAGLNRRAPEEREQSFRATP